jgi:DNA recombination protein RmuC
MEQALILTAGIILGSIIAWFVVKARLSGEVGRAEERSAGFERQLAEATENLKAERNSAATMRERVASAETENRGFQEKLETQKAELEQLQQKLTTEFENLANRILDEKSRKFTEQNRENIGTILTPLQERIKEFQQKVEETYVTESKERVSLEREVKRLAELNQQVSKDASDLTKALKGETKTQGNWGEMILEKVLERSGLREGQEFKVQESKTTEENVRRRPDVIVYLPEEKNVVVDSKVSLTAYERFSSAEDPKDREQHLSEHITSVRNHVKELKLKSYQKLYGINAPDFVLMFMPLEPAFSAALNADDKLFADAFEQGVVLVSPTTLLTTLRTIANLWRQERQNRNVMEIAKQAGDLYDKFVGFVESLQDVGKKIEDAQTAHSDAVNKLSKGRGNLVRRVENIKKLGAQTTKSLPEELVEADADNGENVPAV